MYVVNKEGLGNQKSLATQWLGIIQCQKDHIVTLEPDMVN